MHQPLADHERIHTYVHERDEIGLKDSIINFFMHDTKMSQKRNAE